jgi:hypothetical protein
MKKAMVASPSPFLKYRADIQRDGDLLPRADITILNDG